MTVNETSHLYELKLRLSHLLLLIHILLVLVISTFSVLVSLSQCLKSKQTVKSAFQTNFSFAQPAQENHSHRRG